MARKAIKRPARKRRSGFVRGIKIGLTLVTIMALMVAAVGMAVMLPAFRRATVVVADAGKLQKVERMKPSRVLLLDGTQIFEAAQEFYLPFTFKDVPSHVRQAVLAAEDKRFYKHKGIDPIGLARAVVLAVRNREATQGGSTLTMQLAKQLYNGNDFSLKRKIDDVAVAYELEKVKTKDEILELYMRTAYFGRNAYGLAAAAKTYFNKDLAKLSIGEAAMLARFVRRPSYWNRILDSDAVYQAALDRRDDVLNIMREEGMITQRKYDLAKAELPKISPRFNRGEKKTYPYIVDHAIKEFEREYPAEDFSKGGWTIYVTIDPSLQRYAEEEVRRVQRKWRRAGVGNACMIVADSQGRIMAEVGGVDYERSQYNIVSDVERQPGSSFKPIVYATALATGKIGPGEYLSNAVRNYNGWSPRNSGSHNASGYSLATALALSVNRPAVVAAEKAGPKTVATYGRDAFGIQSPLAPYLSIALGASNVKPIEMAEAYSVFMLGGDRVRPRILARVIQPDGIERDMPAMITKNVFARDVANVMDGLLRNVVTSGNGKPVLSVPDARGKTGTTNSHRDVWFAGYARGIVGIGWAGNTDNRPMGYSTWGSVVVADFWAPIMRRAISIQDDRQAKGLAKNASIQTTVIPIPAAENANDDTPAPRRRRRPRPVETNDAPPPREEPRTPVVIDPDPDPDTAPTPTPDSPPPSNDRDRDRDRDQEKEREQRDRERDEARDAQREADKAREEDRRRERDRQRELRREREREDARRREREDTVSVEVCAETGMRASMYCPETVTRSYPRGRAPRRACTRHS